MMNDYVDSINIIQIYGNNCNLNLIPSYLSWIIRHHVSLIVVSTMLVSMISQKAEFTLQFKYAYLNILLGNLPITWWQILDFLDRVGPYNYIYIC